MRYYRVKKQFDNRIYPLKRKSDGRVYTSVVFGGELVTERELNKRAIPLAWVEELEISSHSTYKSFGVRFEAPRDMFGKVIAYD